MKRPAALLRFLTSGVRRYSGDLEELWARPFAQILSSLYCTPLSLECRPGRGNHVGRA